jgi:hypothetical protein
MPRKPKSIKPTTPKGLKIVRMQGMDTLGLSLRIRQSRMLDQSKHNYVPPLRTPAQAVVHYHEAQEKAKGRRQGKCNRQRPVAPVFEN